MRQLSKDLHLVTLSKRYQSAKRSNKEKRASYKKLRSFLASQYPILAAVSELSKDTSELEKLAEAGPGQAMASVIGEKISETLSNIAKVKKAIDKKVNIWKIPRVVELTCKKLGISKSGMKIKLIQDRMKKEESPGIFKDILLAIINIAAIALAVPTSGLSLAIAAGINVAVAVKDIQNYRWEKTLAGTALVTEWIDQ